jgi:LPS O-antigen subunit length determinant protein (WzzB/FepE family)
LATQLEQAKIKVKEETPVFTVLEPVKVPVDKSSPKRLLVLASSLIIGFIVGACTIFLSQVISKFRIQSV